MRRFVWTAPVLIALGAIETAVFAPHFRQFFCGDSIFWFSRLLETPSDLFARFRELDDLGQYRPLTFAFSSWVVWPAAGLDPFRNHVFPFVFHALNTALVFVLSRRFLAPEAKALVAAALFGLSPVAAYVTYDNTFIPDYLYSFFYLGALVVLCGAFRTRCPGRYAAALGLFLVALSCKEAAVTFPAAALVVLRLEAGKPEWRRIARHVAPFAAGSIAYLGWHLALKGGRLFPADPDQPHHLDVGWANLRSKLPMIAEAFGLPVHLRIQPHWLEQLLLAATGAILLWIAARLLVGLARRDSIYAGGVVWFAATLAPPLFVTAPTWEHNLYLPMAGASWIAAQALYEAAVRLAERPRLRFAAAVALSALLAVNAAVHGASVRRTSWMAAGSRITEQCLSDLRTLHPRIAPNTLLYLESRGEHNIGWHFDGGHMAASFYRDPSIRMRFSGDGRPAPGARMLATGKVILLQYSGGRFYDQTPRLDGPPVEPPQPAGIRISPSPMRRGGWAEVEVLGGPDMEVDCEYLIEEEMTRPRALMSWLTTDSAGRQRLQVNRPGRYRITAIRNALRSDWVRIDYVWECIP